MIETMRYSTLINFVMFVLFSFYLGIYPVYADDLSQLQWESVFEDNDFEYECLAAGVSQTDALWLVAGSRPAGKLSGPQNLSLWRINGTGNVVSKIDVQGLSDKNDVKYVRVQAMAVKDETVLLVMESLDHSVYLVRMDGESNKVIFTKNVETRNDSIFIRKILLTSDNGYLLIGRKLDNPVIIKMDTTGNIMWRNTVSNEKVSIFIDGVEDDGGFNLTGTHLDSSGVTSLWIGKFDLKGKLLLKKEINGRYAGITKDGDGGYVIINDVAGAKGWDVWVRWLTQDFTESTGAEIATDVEVYLPFKIGHVLHGEFLTVGAKESRLWLLRGKKGGDIIWSHIRRDLNTPWEKIWNFDLIESKGNVYIPYTMFRVNEKMEQRQIIKVIKLAK